METAVLITKFKAYVYIRVSARWVVEVTYPLLRGTPGDGCWDGKKWELRRGKTWEGLINQKYEGQQVFRRSKNYPRDQIDEIIDIAEDALSDALADTP